MEYVLQANDATDMNGWLVAIQQCMAPDVSLMQNNTADSHSLNTLVIRLAFLLLNKAIASRAVIVIVSDSDGGQKRFCSQLNNSKTVRDRPYASVGS